MRSAARRFGKPLRSGVLVAAGVQVLLAAATSAQTSAPARSATQPLDARQQEVRARLERLEDRMLRLAQLLAETEPDKADRLRDAVELAGRDRLKVRLGELVTLLRVGQFADAERRQGEVLADLDAVLKLLIDTSGDLDRKRQERERLDAARKAIRAMLEQQLQHLRGTQGIAADFALAEQLRQLAQALERLHQAQREQRTAMDAAAPRVAEQSAAQRELERRTRETAAAIRTFAEGQQGRTAASAGAAAEETRAAADEMQRATEAIEGGNRAAGDESAQRAERDLREAADRLRAEADRLGDREETARIERSQRDTQRRASEAHQQMQEDRAAGRKALPGSENVGKSQQNMQRAADRLGEAAPDQAAPQMQDAADELQTALDEVDAALRQLRREEMEETLAALETRLRSMLAREERVRTLVAELDDKGPARWGRTEQLQLAETAQTQSDVADECSNVQRILVQEGTTIVFPEIMAQLHTDAAAIARRLRDADTSKATQSQLDDVITVLKELLAAVEAQRDRQRQQDANEDGQPPEPDESQPLVPGSAELKLLRTRQIIVRRQTEALAVQGAAPDDARAARFGELGAYQRQLAELAGKMNERQP